MKKLMSEPVKGLKSKVDEIVAKQGVSKSSKMKALFNLGLEVKQIAQLLGVRYNFVYNVVSNMVLIEDIKVDATRKKSKKSEIIKLLEQGLSIKEVAIELKTNYNYVYKVSKDLKAMKASKEKEAK